MGLLYLALLRTARRCYYFTAVVLAVRVFVAGVCLALCGRRSVMCTVARIALATVSAPFCRFVVRGRRYTAAVVRNM